MALAIFDLDNTLLAGDSDYLWGRYLVAHNLVDSVWFEAQNQRYYDQYVAGTLDIQEYLQFQLQPLTQYEWTELQQWRAEFISEYIQPIILPGARNLIEQHKARGDVCLIITATNRFITAPIAQMLGIEHLLATEPEFVAGKFTGEAIDIPCFQEGKVVRLKRWMEEQGAELQGSWFYSDSHNDLPLLKQVSHPVAVNPDATLLHHAQQAGWKILQLTLDD